MKVPGCSASQLSDPSMPFLKEVSPCNPNLNRIELLSFLLQTSVLKSLLNKLTERLPSGKLQISLNLQFGTLMVAII